MMSPHLLCSYYTSDLSQCCRDRQGRRFAAHFIPLSDKYLGGILQLLVLKPPKMSTLWLLEVDRLA